MLVHAGRTSLTVYTQVYRGRHPHDEEIFRAYVTFVCLDKNARPRPVAPFLLGPFSRETLDSAEARGHWDEVELARKQRTLTGNRQGLTQRRKDAKNWKCSTNGIATDEGFAETLPYSLNPISFRCVFATLRETEVTRHFAMDGFYFSPTQYIYCSPRI